MPKTSSSIFRELTAKVERTGSVTDEKIGHRDQRKNNPDYLPEAKIIIKEDS